MERYSLLILAMRWRHGSGGNSDAGVIFFVKYGMCGIMTEKYVTSNNYTDLRIQNVPNIY